jgi:CheY-like chemotaxis protein
MVKHAGVVMKILIVEDEQELAGSILTYLQKENYRCEIADSFSLAKTKLVDYQYECIIVDIGLPGGSGLELIRLVKQMKRQDGIIVISANGALDTKLFAPRHVYRRNRHAVQANGNCNQQKPKRRNLCTPYRYKDGLWECSAKLW